MDQEEFIPAKQPKLDLNLPAAGWNEDVFPESSSYAQQIINQCHGSYSPSRPLHVTILAAGWCLGSSELFSSLLYRELAKQLAKFPQVKVTYLVPENSCSELEKRHSASYGIAIVEAKKQPGFDDPIEYLCFPPEDLSTDIVVGVGEKLNKMVQRFKNHHQCKTIFVATDPTEEAQKNFKRRSNVDPPGIISVADLPVVVGPKMADKLSASLRRQKKLVFELTPGILDEFADITHATSDGRTFLILVTGGDDPKNFYQEGLDIAAKAVAELNDRSYRVLYVGAAEGNQAGFAEKFCHCGVSRYQITIRSLPKDEEFWKRLFCEADLAIMPSGEEEFGMMGLAALSSGLPVLVHGDSGFGEALRRVKFGTSSIVNSEDAKEWAMAIKRVWETKRVVRLEQAALRRHYNEEYSWEKQCGVLVEEMLRMVSVTDEIPTYIQERGEAALAAYHRALETGRTYDKRTRILLIGQDRVGKTSLGKCLRGEPFDKDEPSTDGVEMIPPVKNAGAGAWRNPAFLESTSAFDHKCAEVVTKELLSSSTKQSDSARQFTEEPVRDEKTREVATKDERASEVPSTEEPKSDVPTHEASRRDGTELTKSTQDDRNEQNPEEIPTNVALLIEDGLGRNSPSDNEDIWPVVWDFAGQAVYHAIHPIFLSQEAIYILVSDLTTELSAPAKCRIRPSEHEELEVASPYIEDTNLDHIMRWLDLVHSLQTAEISKQTTDTGELLPSDQALDTSLPPVILVGTHADSVKRLGREPCKEIESVKETICKMAPSAILKHISKESFFIDNTKAGNQDEQEDPQIVSLRLEILNLAKRMPHTGKKIPLLWLRVEETIQEMARNRTHYICKKRFEDIAENICQFNVQDDVEELLHFLQARGTVIYHDLPENPDGLVVLDPQWLIGVLNMLITANPTWKKEPDIQKHYQVLEEKGFLSNQLLNYAFKNLNLEGVRNSLLYIMQKFDLICDSKGCKGNNYPYFVPFMLTLPKNDTSRTMYNGPLPVFLAFNTNFVPSGLFCRLLVLFWEWASQLSDSAPTVFANAARFNVSNVYHLTLESYKTVIKLQLWTEGDSDQKEERRLCKELLSHLEHCRTKLHNTCQWLRSVSWELLVQCTLCKPCPDKCRKKTNICIWHKQQGCCHYDCGHYIPLRGSALSCEYSAVYAPSFCQEKLDPWTKRTFCEEQFKREKQYDIPVNTWDTDHAAQDERKGISQQSYGDPPQLFISLPKLKDLPGELGRIKDVQLPVDILLIAVKDIEFLSCFYYLRDPARIYDHASVGYVYTGHMGEHKEKKLKVALVKCFKGGAVPGGSLATVRNAVPILRPKAVFSVGICSGLNRNKSKLGDVVVSAKLITSSHRPPAKKYMADLLRHAGDGWQAPLQNPQKREVRVHCDGVFVSCLEVTDKLVQHCPEAIAAESEGEGVFAAGHDLNVQWAVVKGVAHYAGDSTVDNERWEHFASVMAASVLANILRNPIIFDEWPNYQAESLRPKMKEENTNWNVMIIIAVVIGFLAIVTSLVLYNGYN